MKGISCERTRGDLVIFLHIIYFYTNKAFLDRIFIDLPVPNLKIFDIFKNGKYTRVMMINLL